MGKPRQVYCFHCTRVTLISKPRHFISMREIQISMREIQISMEEDTLLVCGKSKGNPREIQNPANFAEALLLK